MNCPVAGSVGRVWLDYARFAQEREKLRTAQKIYLRALAGDKSVPAAVTDEQDPMNRIATCCGVNSSK